jgi:hypothetical protein
LGSGDAGIRPGPGTPAAGLSGLQGRRLRVGGVGSELAAIPPLDDHAISE